MRQHLLKVLVLLCIGVATCTSCNRSSEQATSPETTTTFTNVVMTIPYRIVVGKALTLGEKQKVEKVIAEGFADIDAIYNEWNPDSEVSRLNSLGTGEEVALSQELEELLDETDKVVALTAGRFDPTVAPLVQLWKSALSQGEVPSHHSMAQVAPAVGWSRITYGNGTFSKENALTSLNFGGIAKGYAVDMLVQRLKVAGYPDLYVEWGGEIAVAGQHPEGRPWTVFVSFLGNSDPSQAIARIALNDNAIATSGDYLQQWVVNDGEGSKTYTHIIDPQKQEPIEVTGKHVASATVVAPTCALADALATAAMLFDTAEEAQEWAIEVQEKVPGTAFWLVTREASPTTK